MNSAYLFVHFREMATPDGEQVRFSVSRDGFHWEPINDGRPLLWAFYGDHGVRDFTITRCRQSGKFYIFATDLSLAYGLRGKYRRSWQEIREHGSKCLAVWESDDLVNWSEQRLVQLGDDDFGCLWAPDIIYDRENDDYVLHWSSAHRSNNYGNMAIYYSRTRDFEHFTKPALLYRKEDSGVIDSAIYEDNGKYFLFLKSEGNPHRIIQLEADRVTGPYRRIPAFDESMTVCREGLYEAPTAAKLDDGRWCLFLDFYGASAEGQGYVPFLSNDIASGKFVRSDESFSFPYGFKHGSIFPITLDEYERIKSHDWGKIMSW
ncbi:MAG: glycoside hydrolase family 43 protein [Eubacteriales bacterium]